MLLKSRRGDYEVPNLMRWRDRQGWPEFEGRARPLVQPDTRLVAIGSCFAERVTEVLASRGVDAKLHPAGLQYNTFSIRQELDHLFGPDDPYSDEDIVEGADGNWEHVFREVIRGPDRDEVRAASAECDERARAMWSAATVIVITLGLTEIWQRKSDGCVAVTLPPQPAVARGEYTFRNSTTAENLANLRAIIERLRGFSSAPIVVTVSPVPLHATFRDTDIIVANCESKSRLRAVVADLLEEREELHYFHSYELVSHWQGPETFFLEDGRHVSPDGVAFIMNEFLRMYGAPGLRPPFVPFGQIDKPDQTAARRFKNLRSRVAKRVRDIKE